MSSALGEHSGTPVVTEKRLSDAKNPPSKRAKLEVTPSEDYSCSNVIQDDKSNKKMKVQTEYYIRLLLVLVKGGMLVCKGITRKILTNNTLDVFLKPHEPKLKKKLLKNQYLVLFPKSGNPDVEDLDLSLLTSVLLYTEGLSTSDKDYIKIIKETRNKLMHNLNASLEDADYKTWETNLEDALTKLCLGLDMTVQTECSELIHKFTSEPLDEATALKYAKELRNEDELLQDFEGMLKKQSKEIVQEMKAGENRIQERLLDVKQEVKKLQTGNTDNLTNSNFPLTLSDCEICYHRTNTKTGAFYCETCTRLMCTECSKRIHSGEKMHNLHKIEEGYPIKIDMKGYDMCDIHKKNHSRICKSDNKLCCEICVKEKHEHCNKVVSIFDETFESKLDPRMTIDRLQSKADQFIKWMSSIETDVNKTVESIPAKLDEHRNALLKQFDSEEKKVKEKATEMKNRTLKEIKRNEKHCENVIEKTEQAKLPLINMTKCGTAPQKIIAQYRIEEFMSELQSIGDINIMFLHLEHLNLTEKIALHSKLLSVQEEDAITRPVQLFKINELETRQTEREEKKPFYSGMDYLLDGRLVAVDNKNKKCLIYNENLEKVRSYQLSYYPQSVVAVSEEEVAITSGGNYKIDFLHVSKSSEITWNRTCKVTTQYDSISLKDERHFVAGTIDDTRPLRIVSLSGQEEDFSISFQDEKYSTGSTASTYMRNRKKVILTDKDKHAVFIYDNDITKNQTVTVIDDKIKEPRDVAVGPSDCIFVCSNETDSIVQISPTGHVIASHKVDMRFPVTICFSKDETRLAVSGVARGTQVVQVFKVEI